MRKVIKWYFYIPLLAWVAYFMDWTNMSILFQLLAAGMLIGAVFSAVHYSEVIAARVGEPFGTIILAVAITIIEVALIVSLMSSGGAQTRFLARDTVFSAVMLILNAIIGICLLVGSTKHFEQVFQKASVNTALVSLIAILVLTLILPNYTTTVKGSVYSDAQMVFVAFACLVIYGTFLFVQTLRHRNYFLSVEDSGEARPTSVSMTTTVFSLLFLLVSLIVVVLLAKSFSPKIEKGINDAQLPQSLAGVAIAFVILLPEGIAAIRAARQNNIQTSLNLALGSALASIGLTIPAVVAASRIFDLDVVLGLDMKSMVLLGLSVFIVMLSLSKGKTNILYGVVLLVNFVAYIFTVIFP